MDTLFFIAAKLLGAFIRVDTWLVLALGMTFLATVRRRRRQSIGWSAGTLGVVLVLAIVPVGDLLMEPIERQYPSNPKLARVDGIVILGGGEDPSKSAYWQQVQLNEAGDRFTAALALARRFPEARLLYTGGSGALRSLVQGGPTEASLAGRFFSEQGIAPQRLLLEGRSRNTAENARLSLKLAKPKEDEVWVLVNSASHMPRAMRSFKTAGWSGLVAYPVDYRTSGFVDGLRWNLLGNLQLLNSAIKEQIGQLAYRISGNA